MGLYGNLSLMVKISTAKFILNVKMSFLSGRYWVRRKPEDTWQRSSRILIT